jgi:hypothetical protein
VTSEICIDTWQDRVTLAGLHPAERRAADKLAELATSDARVTGAVDELAVAAGVSLKTAARAVAELEAAARAVAELEAAGLLIRRCCALCSNPTGFELIGGRP